MGVKSSVLFGLGLLFSGAVVVAVLDLAIAVAVAAAVTQEAVVGAACFVAQTCLAR